MTTLPIDETPQAFREPGTDSVANFVGHSSGPTKFLPGCRLCSPTWGECKIKLLLEDDNGIAIRLRLRETEWTHELKRDDGTILCNLQELQVLRQVAEEEDSETAIHFKDCNIKYRPQERYSCLFPHQSDEAHSVVELLQNSSIDSIGEKATRESNMLLCPVSACRCISSWHEGVERQVHALAKHWPIRQSICGEVVEGMIDITPITTCRDDLSREEYACTTFWADRVSTQNLPVEVRTNASLDDYPRVLNSMSWAGRTNNDIAIHPSWQEDVINATQPAVLRCKYRKATTQPTKLYDAYTKTTERDMNVEYYLALSYCWNEWAEENESALKEEFDKIAQRLGIHYFWIDRWCIDQGDAAEKVREIPRMRSYYTGASGCVVLTGPDVQPFQCVPRHDGAILSAIQQIVLNEAALRSLVACKWSTRVWTLQEALMSRQVVYAVQNQLIDGDYISELIAYVETSSEYHTGNYQWIGGYGCYGWNANYPSVVFPRQFRMEDDDDSYRLIILRTVFGGEQQYRELQSKTRGVSMPFEEALAMFKGRDATREEDYIYGILGITERGGEIRIEYGIDWTTMLGKLKHAGMITERQLASPTVNKLPGMSWLPACGSGYGPFTNIAWHNTFVYRPKLAWSEEGAAVLAVRFEWVNPTYGGRNLTVRYHGLGSEIMYGDIRFPDIPGLCAMVWGTSELEFTEKRVGGTHLMLCSEVDEKTRKTVAIKVAENPEGGNINRKDGYILEISYWLEGSPRMLRGRGRRYVIGSAPVTSTTPDQSSGDDSGKEEEQDGTSDEEEVKVTIDVSARADGDEDDWYYSPEEDEGDGGQEPTRQGQDI